MPMLALFGCGDPKKDEAKSCLAKRKGSSESGDGCCVVAAVYFRLGEGEGEGDEAVFLTGWLVRGRCYWGRTGPRIARRRGIGVSREARLRAERRLLRELLFPSSDEPIARAREGGS